MASQTSGEYRGITWESNEELYFLYWIFELKDRGYVNSIERPTSHILSSAVVNKYELQLKTKTKQVEQILLQEHVYTPEFLIIWNSQSEEKLISVLRNHRKFDNDLILAQNFPRLSKTLEPSDLIYSYVEIKPIWDHQNMTRLFRLNQKWTWDKYRIYVNLIFPRRLFQKTFTPNEYLYTEKKRDKRSIEWKIVTCDEFLTKNKEET